MIPYQILKELLVEGVRFTYQSYDHKKAVLEMSNNSHISPTQKNANYYFGLPESCWGVPEEVKQNNLVWRIGKLRQITFDKNGKMVMFKIGCRWSKTFYLDDFGVKVKPMIFKSDDVHDLIGQGLAVEETI